MKKNDAGLAALRREYQQGSLRKADVNPDPFIQFNRWLDEAIAAGVIEPNAMTLATAAADGSPSARIVLLKECTPSGFVFYSNYLSCKGRQLKRNPRAALVFYWADLQRQARVTGVVHKLSGPDSDAYFSRRPRNSQISACISPQSEVISSRAFLEQKFSDAETAWEGREISRPEQWGGYRLVPAEIEFWQGRRDRLHDRIRFSRGPDDRWTLDRLGP